MKVDSNTFDTEPLVALHIVFEHVIVISVPESKAPSVDCRVASSNQGHDTPVA